MQQTLWLKQLIRFIGIGLLAVLIDASLYSLFLHLYWPIPLSKGLALIIASTTAYFANKSLTFRFKEPRGYFSSLKYILLYICTLSLNTGLNSLFILLLTENEYKMQISYIGATATSTITNFIGLKFWVFRIKGETE